MPAGNMVGSDAQMHTMSEPVLLFAVNQSQLCKMNAHGR